MDALCLTRHPSENGRTIGDLSIDGKHFCYTLEDVVREVKGQPVSAWKIKGKTAIPAGRYRVAATLSARFRRVTLQLLNVPGFTGIRIHSGNTQRDTEGCIIVGDVVDAQGIRGGTVHSVLPKLESVLFPRLLAGEEIWITVE